MSSSKKFGQKFTSEEKKEYFEKKEEEKKELLDLYKSFMEAKTIEEIIKIVENYSQIHEYSFRNVILICMQGRNIENFAGIVNSFQNWKKQKISVLKGSRGIKVWAPIFVKKTITDEDGEEKEEEILRRFKLGSVFDISQTTAYDEYIENEKKIDEVIMKHVEINFEDAMIIIKKNFPELIIKEDFRDFSPRKGSFNVVTNGITLFKKSSHTLFHETGHYVNLKVLKVAHDKNEEYAKSEILAEMFCYLLMKRIDLNTEYNFKYSNVWASRIEEAFEFGEFEEVYTKIKKFVKELKF